MPDFVAVVVAGMDVGVVIAGMTVAVVVGMTVAADKDTIAELGSAVETDIVAGKAVEAGSFAAGLLEGQRFGNGIPDIAVGLVAGDVKSPAVLP